MKLKAGIGITTYKDTSDPAFGAEVYEAYRAASPKLLPTQISVWSKRFPVTGPADIAAHWLTKAAHTTRESRAKDARVLERLDLLIGGEWKTKAPLSGGGRPTFRPNDDLSRENTLILEHNFSPSVDWWSLFCRLVDLMAPSYGMLHVFDEESRRTLTGGDLSVFDRPFAGEHHFTSWKTPLNTWRKPDHWQLRERRQYRHLPDLSWANYFGPEFEGQYDLAVIRQAAEFTQEVPKGLLVRITPSLIDVADMSATFLNRRKEVKSAFREGFFRN